MFNECPLKYLCIRFKESDEDAFVESISKLQELEDLHLECNQLSTENFHKLLSLPKLQKFSIDEFENVDNLLDAVVETRRQDVVALTCNENFLLYLSPNRFENVRKITIIDEGVVEGIWCARSVNKTLREFPHLAELYLENTSIWSGGGEFWHTVSSCSRIKLLHLTKLNIDDDKFFQFSDVTIQKLLRQREEPLVINFVKTGCDNVIYQCFKHPKLKISCISELDSTSNLTGGMLEIEFTQSLISSV